MIYASDNGDLYSDHLCFFADVYAEFCRDLERVISTEAASGVSLQSNRYICHDYVHWITCHRV